MIFRRFVMLAALLALAPQTFAESPPRIAIIIDDLGYQLAAGRRAIKLPGPVAYAILPATPSGVALAEAAHRSGKEVLLHLPLQAVDHTGPPEPGGITLDMSRADLGDAFAAAIASVPHAVGVSSHRGSLLTRHPGHMGWLMQEIQAHGGLFFVDSYTTHLSVALQIAGEAGVTATRRDVFLDSDRSVAAITREYERLKQLAREQGVAVGIGHPYPETLAFLEQKLHLLSGEGFKLIPISELLLNPLQRSGSKTTP